MKKFITPVAFILLAFTSLNSCKKELVSQQTEGIAPDKSADLSHGHLQQTKTYSSEVAYKWMDMQFHLMYTNPTPLPGAPSVRLWTYPAIALYESVVPGMPAYQSLSGQLTDLPAMPSTLNGTAYSWPICANSALATTIRHLFPNTTNANKTAIDSLENALNEKYKMQTDNEEFQRSVDFGKAVGEVIFTWSTTDGSANANAPYTPPVGPGLWVPTPPAFAKAATPYWGDNRLMVSTSLDGPAPQAPPVYSTDPNSDYYKMMKEVYDASLTLTNDQKAVAYFWSVKPGFPGAGSGPYLSLLEQILVHENPQLDFTAYVWAKVSIAMNDAAIGCFKVKFQYNQQRPVTFARTVLGEATWTPIVVTPPFPDFLSAHSSLAGSFAEILEGFFGTNYNFTDHTFDFQGQSSRFYSSFDALIQDISDARFYGGIHSRFSCSEGAKLGRKVAQNVNNTLMFLKE